MTRTEEVIHLRSLFRQYGQDMDLKIQLIKEMRDIAILYLPKKVITKVPKSRGISTEWNLTIRGDTGIDSFYFSASKANLTVSQESAANLLFYCTRVIEDNAPLDSYLEAILSNYSMLSIDDAITGEIFKKNQKARAQRGRPRRYKGKTIGDVIKRLKKQHPRESVSELWPHLKYAIEDWGGGRCVLQETGIQGSQRYEYELAEENKKFTITFDTFRKKLIKLEKN